MLFMNVPGPKAQEVITRDHAVMSPSYPRGYPFVMDHGRGTEVWDVDGNRYLDFAAGIAVVSTGHSHPKVVKAIQDQAEKFIHISSDFYHPLWVELAEKLNEISPFQGSAISFMTNSGTESVEAAIKLARYHTGRSQFIAFLGAVHGRMIGSVTFTASKPEYHRGFFPLMNGVVHVPSPDPYRPILQPTSGQDGGETVVRYIEEQILSHLVPPEDIAGIVVEPIQGEGGYVIPPPGFLPVLRQLCDRYGILLIADGVQSEMGRTGKWWAIEQFGVEPAIVCSAKGIASGMPFGAMIVREHIMTWPKGAHGNTCGGNPICCAAALATIDLIEKEYMKNATEVGAYTKDILEEIKARHPSVGDVRGMGLLLGVEFSKDHYQRQPAKELRDQIIDHAFELGLILLGCSSSTIRIAPPLSVTKSEVDEAIEKFEEAITAAEKENHLVHVA